VRLRLVGQEYTIAHSAYAPMTSSSEKQPLQHEAAQTSQAPAGPSQETIYNQPKLTAELLQRISKSNERVLKSLSPAHNHHFEGHAPKNLHSLAVIGAEDSKLSWQVWQALWKELTSPCKQNRTPVLVALDGINHWMTLSRYRSAEYNPIHALQLAPVRHFIEILFNKNGKGELAHGGMVLAATTASNSPSAPAFELLMKQLEAQEKGLKMGDEGFPVPPPYKTVDQRVLDFLEGSDLNVQRLQGLEKDVEARGLLEYFAKSGVFRETVSENTVAEKWSLAGGGVIGEMARFGQRLRQ
jgi:small subunit ribosomal protein S29